MATLYTVRQEGLVVDLILWRKYGRRGQGLIEETLALNPGLAEIGPILPLGTAFTIPDLPAELPRLASQPVSLFD